MIHSIFLTTFFFSFLSTIYSTCSSSSGSSNQTCLHVVLSDRYGDGWDGAKLYVEFPDGSQGKILSLSLYLSLLSLK